MKLLARNSIRTVHVDDNNFSSLGKTLMKRDLENKRKAVADDITKYHIKAPLFDELIHNLDDQLTLSNIERLEKESPMHDIKAEFVYMSGSAAEMAVV